MNSRFILSMPVVLLLVTACGQDNAPGAAGDSYVNAVSRIADSTSENSEPVEVDALNPSMPENRGPQAI